VRYAARWLIEWPESVARYLTWLAPLFARITVGWVFLWSGWGKLTHLPSVIENFIGWGIPFPHVLTPFVAGLEFFGGILLLLGLFTRISAGALGITMIVAIRAAKWGDVDSLETLLGFDEFEYLALFVWLAIAGPGRVSLDAALKRYLRWRDHEPRPAPELERYLPPSRSMYASRSAVRLNRGHSASPVSVGDSEGVQ
jgi:putative oxidoreductase